MSSLIVCLAQAVNNGTHCSLFVEPGNIPREVRPHLFFLLFPSISGIDERVTG
jgi:hypothetical protein